MAQERIKGHVPIEIIESALNTGFIEVKSEQMMKYFESMAGHRIYTPKPIDNQFKEIEQQKLAQYQKQQLRKQEKNNLQVSQNSPKITNNPKVANSKVVGSTTKMPAFLEKGLKISEMYKIATDESTKLRDSNEVLKHKNFGLSLAARYKDWITPELFDYISMKGPRAEAEFRAACYPARVAFSHRIQTKEGRVWATPYITVFIPTYAKDSQDDWNVGYKERAYSFYLTNTREIHAICDDVLGCETIKSPETREKQQEKSIKEWKNSSCEKRVRVFNPKTGVEQYALLKTDGTEGWQEKYFFKKDDYYKWMQTYDVTNSVYDGKVDFDEHWGKVWQENSLTEQIAKESIAKIPSIVMSDQNLVRYTPSTITYYDKKGNYMEEKAPKGCEYYQDNNTNDFVHYWNQMIMDRECGFSERESWGD